MLVLSRQRDQTIMIGDHVEITVVDIRGDKVRLGITAPAHIPVHRKEVYEAIKRENRDAATVTPEDIGTIVSGVPNPKQAKSVRPPMPHGPGKPPAAGKDQSRWNGKGGNTNKAKKKQDKHTGSNAGCEGTHPENV